MEKVLRLPSIKTKDQKVYVPTMIFRILMTYTNFGRNDKKKSTVAGQNGVGAKLCNIFSKEFTVKTASTYKGNLPKHGSTI